MKKLLKWGLVGFVVLVVLGTIGQALTPDDQVSNNQEQQTQAPSPTREPTTQVLSLSHSDLLKIAKDSPNSVIGKTYDTTLYLEQAPTSTQAEFMTQPDDNSMDTILVLCNMRADDLAKLDGASAQKRNYKPYDLSVSFTKYNSQVGLYYEAQCAMANR